jgi:hypothetical protein
MPVVMQKNETLNICAFCGFIIILQGPRGEGVATADPKIAPPLPFSIRPVAPLNKAKRR